MVDVLMLEVVDDSSLLLRFHCYSIMIMRHKTLQEDNGRSLVFPMQLIQMHQDPITV